MCHRASPVAVAVPDAVQGHALAIIETDTQRPVLPSQQVALERERRPVGLLDRQRLERLAPRGRPDAIGNVLGHILAHHIRRLHPAVVLDPQQLHGVDVDDAVQSTHGMGVRVRAGRGLHPGVRPTEPAVAVLRWCHRFAVGPGVHEDEVNIGDPALGQCRLHVGVGAQHLVTLEEFVDGEIGLHTGDVFERLDMVVGQGHHALVGGIVGALQAGHRGAARRHRPAVVERSELGLARFDQFDRGDAPAIPYLVLAAQEGCHPRELLTRQRIQWVINGLSDGLAHIRRPRSMHSVDTDYAITSVDGAQGLRRRRSA